MAEGHKTFTLSRWPEAARWGACFVFAIAFHAAGAAALFARWSEDSSLVANAPVIMVDLAPVAVSPNTTPTDVPIGPEQQQAEPEPEPEKPIEKIELPPDPKAEPVVAMPPPKPVEVEKPKEKKPKQKHASLASTPSVAEQKAGRAAAPMPGASSRHSDALPNWITQVSAKLQRNKRYPSEARGDQGIVSVRFNVDRQGGVHEGRRRVRRAGGPISLSADQLRGPAAAVQAAVRGVGPLLGLSEEENRRAVDGAFRELFAYEAEIQRRAREVLDRLEREQRVGIVVLARPYHHDPGLNHEILEEFQKLGYPVFSQNTLPMDADLLERLFGEEVKAGVIRDPLEIQDVWKNSYSANTNLKVWAAKFTARHHNLVALELSSFKCGHDAPIYSVVEGIIEKSGTPYFSFKDIDENKPSGSIRIRVETIHYFLRRYIDDMRKKPVSAEDIERQLAAYERKLREEMLREAELAALAERHHALATEMELSGRLLPLAGAGSPSSGLPA